MFYTIYQTTNLTNGKIYIGYHSTEDLNDQYLGSGKIIIQAIDKIGAENFKREILYVFPTKEEALQKEREIVNEKFLQRDDVYNIKLGGEGGWDHCRENCQTEEALTKRSQSAKIAVKEGRLRTLTNEQRMMGTMTKPFLGRTHTEESKRKIALAQQLDNAIIDQRISDFNSSDKKRGYITKLANKWNVSHTQVKRFLKQQGLV
jgi:group I intron endonuclease